ncbi:fasciclin domain-containing protein [Nonomuraea sp. NPDC050643]|uniref:fasciclin domain-containing protein n=1 Tax=Nonomuraea sp. NPDC050643 TaxID=3155660 RepID=UPI0033DF803F
MPETSLSPEATASPSGPGCAAIEDGLSGIADEKAGTALSRISDLSMLSEAVKAAKLEETLNSTQDITIFAPNNKAFEAVPQETRDKLLADKAELTKVLSHHVVKGETAPADLEDATLTTLQGGDLTVAGSGDDLTVDQAHIVCGGVQTSNATIYVIDKVLMPES